MSYIQFTFPICDLNCSEAVFHWLMHLKRMLNQLVFSVFKSTSFPKGSDMRFLLQGLFSFTPSRYVY